MIRLVCVPFVLACCLLLPHRVVAAEPSTEEELREMLADVCRKHKVPSLTIAVVRSDEVVATACYGVRKLGTDNAVELPDLHPIGSCTKSLTATLAAVVVESGKIQWDTTIGQVWPQAPAEKLHAELRDVTLNELLSHQSGLQSDIDGADWLSFFEEKASPARERRRMLGLILGKKPKHARGEYHYSNLGYVVAAAMLEKVTDKSYEGMMRRFVFKPLEMNRAVFRTLATAKKFKKPLLWGHRAGGEPIDPRVPGGENPSVYTPCGTLNLTIADYARYAQWQLGGSAAPVLTKQETFDHLHTGHVEAKSLGGKYGCGWIFVDTGLGRALNHGGSNTNSQALIWILPERDFAAIACTNTGEQTGFLASDEAIRELMKRYARTLQAD